MKTNQLVLLLMFLMLGAAAAQQTNSSPGATSDMTVEALKARAEKGDVAAQYSLGFDYFFGEGVARNFAEGVAWLNKAAENGNETAQNLLGTFYENGTGGAVLKDYVEAAKWFLRAAKQGDSQSQIDIANMYENGEGVMQDYVEAYKWLNIAAISTNKPPAGFKMDDLSPEQREAFRPIADKARETRERLAQQMTAEQIAQAQQLAHEFRPRKEGSSNSFSPDNPTATGTGFFITEDGYLISNYHVVRDATKVRVVTSTGIIDATVVKVDTANDLALLKAVGKFTPLPVAASRGVKLGGTVATVGFPNIGLQGFSPKLAKGEIASLSGAVDDARYFQISVPVQPGNSGGALVDEHGNVIGIVSAKLDASVALAATGALPENVNYAVKSSFLLSFLESVPAVSAKLKEPITADRKFEDVVKSAQDAAALVLVY